MLSWHTKQTTAVRRSELMLDWWSKAVVAAREMGTRSVDPKHPQKCGWPPKLSGQVSKNEVSEGESGSFLLKQHC